MYTTPGMLMFHFRNYLEWLNLSHNHFELLGHFSNMVLIPNFPYMKNLKTLLLRYSGILSIELDTFWNLYNLRHLDLTGNGLLFVPKSVLLSSLESLNLSYQNDSSVNFIKFRLEEGIFEQGNMTNLKNLSLSGVNMKLLKKRSFDGLPNLEIESA